MIKRYDENWENQYKKFNLTEEEMNRANDKNSFIFNYITNDLGYKIGVVVAQKREDNVAPYIGWALFSEIAGYPNVYVTSFYDIPKFQEYMTNMGVWQLNKLGENCSLVKTLKNFSFLNCDFIVNEYPTAYHIPSRHYRDYLLNLALARAVPYNEENRQNYFCPYVSDTTTVEKANLLTKGRISFGAMKNHITDLSNETIKFKETKKKKSETFNFGEYCYNTVVSNYVRHAIRKMEFRAWKYYKKSF